MIDDALDYKADEATLGKTVGDDFAEGKITLPVLIAHDAGSAEEKEFWMRTIERREQNDGDLATAQRLIAQHETIGQTVQRAQEFGQKAKDALSIFPESALRQAMLDVVDFSISRGH